MLDYIVAGASMIEDIPKFVADAQHFGISVLLIENLAMLKHIPEQQRMFVVCCEEIPNALAPVIPLNEFWVTRAIQANVTNISQHAFRASRSKYYLSRRLAECGLNSLTRRYLENVPAPYPKHYLARLDAAYSGYGIVRHVEAGDFNPVSIARMVQKDAKYTMRVVLGEDSTRVVVEEYLVGEEYSVDVFVHDGKIVILRLFQKIIIWTAGRPVCDSYIAVPHDPDLCATIHDWCEALYSNHCTSFGQYDFIIADGRAIAVDFSCRIGGGLSAIKRFSGNASYVAIALAGASPSFTPFTVQKNIVARGSGRLSYLAYDLPESYQVTVHKHVGDLLPPNISSANSRIAEICFIAYDLKNAKDQANALNNKVIIDIDEKN